MIRAVRRWKNQQSMKCLLPGFPAPKPAALECRAAPVHASCGGGRTSPRVLRALRVRHQHPCILQLLSLRLSLLKGCHHCCFSTHMERAVEAARQGDLLYFSGLASDQVPDLIKQKDEDRRSLLHTAAASGNLQLVQWLADHGGASYINEVDEEGWAPLHSATSAGHEQVARLLISLGADVNAATAQKRTPLHYASSKGQAGLALALLDAGAAVDCKDVTGATPLHRAAATGRVDVIRVLLGEGSGGGSRGGSGAAQAGGEGKGRPAAKLDARNREKQTPLLLAALGGHHAAALLLAGKGADVEAEDADGETPLGAAAAHGKLREGLAALAKGEMTLDDFMLE